MHRHSSHHAFFRQPAGPAPAGSKVTFRFLSDESSAVTLRVWMGEDSFHPMTLQPDGMTWQCTVQMPETTGLLWYDFTVEDRDGSVLLYGAPEDGLGGEGRVWKSGLHSFQITIYDPHFCTPSFLHGATISQIFPDRFFRAPTEAVDTRGDRRMHADWDEDFFPNRPGENGSMDFWGGTINGIRAKLPYLRELGITVLYLNPVFQAKSNHRYDTGDYTKVDPLLGTNDDLRELFREAGAMGIRIMMDGVFSHTGEDSIYFNREGHYDSVGAAQSKDSPYYGWYTFEHWPDKYRCWWGVDALPECRKQNPEYQDFILGAEHGIVPLWIREGSAGWRLDVADELPMDFLRRLRQSAKRVHRDAVVLGEVWEDASSKIAYDEMRCYCTGDTLDSVMNYPLREAILAFVTGGISAHEFVRRIHHQAEVYPVPFLYSLMNLLGSHDRARVLNTLVGQEARDWPKAEQAQLHLSDEDYALAVRRYKLCLDLLCALPGCPTVYYGDEAGLTGAPDPYCRKPYPWGHEDKELLAYVRGRLNHRRASTVLKTGLCEAAALDDDTVRIRRYMQDGHDAFGHKTSVRGQEVITVRR